MGNNDSKTRKKKSQDTYFDSRDEMRATLYQQEKNRPEEYDLDSRMVQPISENLAVRNYHYRVDTFKNEPVRWPITKFFLKTMFSSYGARGHRWEQDHKLNQPETIIEYYFGASSRSGSTKWMKINEVEIDDSTMMQQFLNLKPYFEQCFHWMVLKDREKIDYQYGEQVLHFKVKRLNKDECAIWKSENRMDVVGKVWEKDVELEEQGTTVEKKDGEYKINGNSIQPEQRNMFRTFEWESYLRNSPDWSTVIDEKNREPRSYRSSGSQHIKFKRIKKALLNKGPL